MRRTVGAPASGGLDFVKKRRNTVKVKFHPRSGPELLTRITGGSTLKVESGPVI
jgi:hypothetical protein